MWRSLLIALLSVGCADGETPFEKMLPSMESILLAMEREPSIKAMTESRGGMRSVWLQEGSKGMSHEVQAGSDQRSDLPLEAEWLRTSRIEPAAFATIADVLDRSAIEAVRRERGCTWFLTGGWIDDHVGFARCGADAMPDAWVLEKYGGGWYRYSTVVN